MKLKWLKIIIFSASIAFVIAVLPVVGVIVPIHKKHVLIRQEEKRLHELEEKSARISEARAQSVQQVSVLRNELRQQSILTSIEGMLNNSQLLIESIKLNQGGDHHELHVALKGKYRSLLYFISMLSRRLNAQALIYVSIDKNRIEMVFKDKSESEVSAVGASTKQPSNLSSRLALALLPIHAPHFSLRPGQLLSEVRSPFVPRRLPASKGGPFQSLLGREWHWVGEVRQNGVLLGIFVEAYRQSHYFGVGLPWENGDWRIIALTKRAVIFENLRQKKRWRLLYTKSAVVS